MASSVVRDYICSVRVTWTPIVSLAAAGAASATLISVANWDLLKMGVMAALAVVAAAALVRLARGLPFTNADHFQADEVELITNAVQVIARSIRAFLLIVLATMIGLVFLAPATRVVTRLLDAFGRESWFVAPGASFLMGAAMGYVLIRLWQIVGSDISLLEKQSELMVRAVHRKARLAEETADKQAGHAPFVTPEGYGRQLQ